MEKFIRNLFERYWEFIQILVEFINFRLIDTETQNMILALALPIFLLIILSKTTEALDKFLRLLLINVRLLGQFLLFMSFVSIFIGFLMNYEGNISLLGFVKYLSPNLGVTLLDIAITIIIINRAYEILEERKRVDDVKKELFYELKYGEKQDRKQVYSILRNNKIENIFLHGTDLSGEDLSDIYLQQCHLKGLKMVNTQANSASLSKNLFTYADFSGAKFYGCEFKYSEFFSCKSINSPQGIEMQSIDFEEGKIRNSIFRNSKFRGIFKRTQITENTDLSGSEFVSCDFTLTRFEDCILDNITIEYPTNLIEKSILVITPFVYGFSFLNCSLKELSIRSDRPIFNASFYRSNLTDSKFEKQMIFAFCSFENTKLLRANLSYCRYYFCDFSNANLSSSILSGSNLLGSNFQNAVLSNADLRATNLKRVKFKGANLTGTLFTESNVSMSQLLEAAELDGATLPDGTIYNSNNNAT